jgi:hypothetical protein
VSLKYCIILAHAIIVPVIECSHTVPAGTGKGVLVLSTVLIRKRVQIYRNHTQSLASYFNVRRTGLLPDETSLITIGKLILASPSFLRSPVQINIGIFEQVVHCLPTYRYRLLTVNKECKVALPIVQLQMDPKCLKRIVQNQDFSQQNVLEAHVMVCAGHTGTFDNKGTVFTCLKHSTNFICTLHS